MKIVFIGDIYGRTGRDALQKQLPVIKETYEPDFVIVNGENSAHGHGITKKICEEMFGAGVDCITTGDHVWDQREMISQIENEPRLLRPINLPAGTPGNGGLQLSNSKGQNIYIINAMGRTFMSPIDCPFRRVEKEIQNLKLGQNIDAIFVDFHAEATSEKMAFGHYFDGKISGVIGTHTHIPTADAHVMLNGTAYQTDAGMTGDYDSVIGRRKDISIFGFLRQMPGEKPQPASGEATVCGACIETNEATGLAVSITSFKLGGVLND